MVGMTQKSVITALHMSEAGYYIKFFDVISLFLLYFGGTDDLICVIVKLSASCSVTG